MGLLDTLDPGILALLQGPTADDAAAIKKHALLTAGLAMMQHANMKPIQAIGYGGLVGMQSANDEQAMMAQQRAQRLAGFGQAMNLQNQLQQFQDQAGARQVLQNHYANQGLPGSPPQDQAQPSAAPPSAPPQSAPSGPWQPGMPLPPDAPPDWSIKTTNDGIPYMAPPGGAKPAPVSIPPTPATPVAAPAKAQKFEQYTQIGDELAKKGLVVQAQQYYDIAEKFRPKLKETKTLTQNNQRVTVNLYDDGTTQVLPLGPDKEKLDIKNIGQTTQGFDPYTGAPVGPGTQNTVTPGEAQSNAIQQEKLNIERVNADPLGMLGLNKQGAAAGGSAGQALGGGANGQALLSSLPQPIADQVKALAEGRMAFPAGFALKSPYWQTMISLVSQYDPSFDAINYNARSKTRADFTSGKSAVQANALNTVIGHLGQLSDAADALKNTSFPMLNTATNFLATQTGDPRVKQFETTRKAVVDELTRVYRGTGGSEGDIKTWSDQINAANSPEQFRAVASQIGGLLESKMEAMRQQYEKGMGTTAEGLQLLNPHAREALDKIEGKNSAPSGPLVKNTTALYKAQQAIKAGADPAAVRARLRAAGVDPSGL